MATREKLVEIIGKNNKVCGVKTTKCQYDVDLVWMSVGFRPLTDVVKDCNLAMNEKGAIIVNDQQESSIKDAYAIGDCATICNNAADKKEHSALVTNAVRTGIVAAHNAANTTFHMQGVQASNAIHIFALTLCSAGITQKSAKELDIDVDFVTICVVTIKLH